MTLRNKVIFSTIFVTFFAPALSSVEELQASPVAAAPRDQEQKTSEVQSQERLQTEAPAVKCRRRFASGDSAAEPPRTPVIVRFPTLATFAADSACANRFERLCG
jgi:hypothetical protein